MKDLNREIELNRIVGEMVGTLIGIKVNYRDSLGPDIRKRIDDLLKRYDDLFKDEK